MRIISTLLFAALLFPLLAQHPLTSTRRWFVPKGSLTGKALADSAFGKPATIFATACKRTLANYGNLPFTSRHTPQFD